MARYRFSEHVVAPVDVVFGAFTDFENASENVSAIKSLEILTEGPIGKGTRFRETRTMFGRDATEEMEITDFQAGKSYTVGCESCGAVWTSTFTFSPAGDGTDVHMEMRTRPVTFMAKLMSPLSFLFAGTMKKCIQADLTDLKALCEQPAGAPA